MIMMTIELTFKFFLRQKLATVSISEEGEGNLLSYF